MWEVGGEVGGTKLQCRAGPADIQGLGFSVRAGRVLAFL